MHIVNKAKTLPEVFDKIRSLESREDKIKFLKLYKTNIMQLIVDIMYNVDTTEIDIPEYTPNTRPPEICNMTLNTAKTRLVKVFDGRSPKNIVDKNLLLILEEVSKDESDLLVDIIRGRKIQGISKSIFKEVFPELFRFQEQPEQLEEDNA